MTDTSSVQFYAAIRKDPETLARIAAAASEAELIELLMDEAEKRGFTATADMVKSALADLGSIVEQAAGSDELTEMELEIVSGGMGEVRGPNIGPGGCGTGYTSTAKRG